MPSINQETSGTLILALDTSSSIGSVALARGDELLIARAFEADRGHSRQLLPAVDSVFSEAKLRPADVDVFATVIGPGSFTGLRVSLACVRGLAGARPCFGAVSTDAAAWAARGRGARILAITDLFHGEVFGGVHDETGALIGRHESGEPDAVLAALANSLGETGIAIGSATVKHRDRISDACPGIRFVDLKEGLAPHLASLTAARAATTTFSSASDLLPFYLRDPLTRGLLNTQPKQP